MANQQFNVQPLDASTWEAFADLVRRHGGVWGGCWCTAFHGRPKNPEENYREKECRVREGRTHAALVLSGERAVGWCQFGRPAELPRIKHRKAYDAGSDSPPDWRITCFFVDREFRGQGVASAALVGAIELISVSGGGLVESYPEDTTDRKVSGSFLYNGTIAMFEREGFARSRQIGKHHWVLTKLVKASSQNR